MVDKITCMLHKVHFEDGVCPECESLKQTVTITLTSDNPVHESDYIKNLDYYTKKLNKLNDELNKLLGNNKPKDTE